MKRELNIFVLRTALFAAPILLLFELLYHFGYYPIITDSSLFDRKVNLVRNRRLQRVDLMAMGSSVTLYDLNSREMVTAFDKPYYNFSSVNLQCTDIRILLRQFAKEYKPEYIVTCSSIREFIHPRDSTYLNYTNTNKFIRDHFPEYFYFHKYSSLYRLIWRKNKLSPLIIDEWGGASWTVPKADMIAANGNEHEIFPTEYTEMQYRELDSLAAWLAN
ncbi:MAG TPA: hypothetical protein VNW04_21745, partial [Puia sp.]|nr:hypothetical protein [Puia sp.]